MGIMTIPVGWWLEGIILPNFSGECGIPWNGRFRRIGRLVAASCDIRWHQWHVLKDDNLARFLMGESVVGLYYFVGDDDKRWDWETYLSTCRIYWDMGMLQYLHIFFNGSFQEHFFFVPTPCHIEGQCKGYVWWQYPTTYGLLWYNTSNDWGLEIPIDISWRHHVRIGPIGIQFGYIRFTMVIGI